MEALNISAERGTPLPCLISWLLYLRMLQFAVAATVMSLAAFSWSRFNDVPWQVREVSWEVVYAVVAVSLPFSDFR